MPNAGDFGDVERTFTTTGGDRVSKVRTSRGGVLYYSEEKGQIDADTYGGLSANRREVQLFQEKDTDEIETEELSLRYQQESTMPIGDLPPGSIERERTKQRNMFVGFFMQDDTPDDRIEAVRDYENMVRDLRQADNPEQEREIKERYNIGGTP